MSTFGGLVLTNKGRNLQSKAQAGVTLTFTRVGVGDGELGSTSILSLNKLVHEVLSLDITKLRALGEGRSVVGTILSNQDMSTGFYFRELGVYAQDPDLGEVLYCYGNSGELAEYIAAGGGTDIIEKSIDIQTVVGNASNVTAVINSSLVYVTYDEFSTKAMEWDAKETPTGAQEKVKAHENKSAPHSGHEKISNKGVAGGYPTLDAKGKIPLNQLPDLSENKTIIVSTYAERDALTDLKVGDRCIVLSPGDGSREGFIWDGASWLKDSDTDWENINLDWSNISGKPQSTPEEIDQAVNAPVPKATAIKIDDVGNYYESTDTEGALQEVGYVLNGVQGALVERVNAVLRN